MAVIQGVAFDLDDTLYLEQDYVRSGFRAVAAMLTAAEGPAAEDLAAEDLAAEDLFQHLWDLFTRGCRGDTFDRLLGAYPYLARRHRTEELVSAYRSHSPAIAAPPATRQVLDRLHREGYRLGLISDGLLPVQQAKWQALAVTTPFDPIIFTDAWGQPGWKPNPLAFQLVADAWRLPPAGLVYVGDNPQKDFVAPRRLGWQTIRIRQPGQVRWQLAPPDAAHAPHREIGALSELHQCLSALGQSRPER